MLPSCQKDDADVLTLPQNSFNDISFEGQQVAIAVTSNTVWSVSSDQTWCVVNTPQGNGSSEMSLTIAPNYALSARTANISIQTAETTRTIEVKQNLWDLENYTFKLPIIFHILYNDPLDENQYVRKGWMAEVIKKVNLFYHNGFDKNSAVMPLEFVMATHTPDGRELAEPGVNRVRDNNADGYGNSFTEGYSHPELLWNPEKYINIFIVSRAKGSNLGGRSTFPYTTIESPLPGTKALDFWPVRADINYMHGIIISNEYIYRINSSEGKLYDTRDISFVVAHELGHYLGLYHMFSESNTGTCLDTDYCADTPCYDRQKYNREVEEFFAANPDYTYNDLMNFMYRTNCVTGEVTKPNNVMDYEYSWVNRFTPDQRKRVCHILAYSPFIPGPKIKPETKALNSRSTRVLTPKFVE